MKFPILLKDTPDAPPPSRLYYEVAANGVFQVKDNPLYRSVTRVTREVPGLHPARERLEMLITASRAAAGAAE